jgi:hypothetical protein
MRRRRLKTIRKIHFYLLKRIFPFANRRHDHGAHAGIGVHIRRAFRIIPVVIKLEIYIIVKLVYSAILPAVLYRRLARHVHGIAVVIAVFCYIDLLRVYIAFIIYRRILLRIDLNYIIMFNPRQFSDRLEKTRSRQIDI